MFEENKAAFLYPDFPFQFEQKGEIVHWNYTGKELKSIIEKQRQKIEKEDLWKVASVFFKDEEDKPFHLSPAEYVLFRAISQRIYPRLQVLCSTQYGKTLTVARALLLRITTMPDEWLVTVPDQKRGKILMNYMIQDAARNPYFRGTLVGLDLGNRDSLNRLLEERSKVRLTFRVRTENGGEKISSIFIVSAEAKRRNDPLNAVMGFGGKNVLSDESSLISDELESGIFRMLAGKGDDTCYVKIGNAFSRGHFLKSWKNPSYKKIFVDDRIGLADGRYNSSFLAEAKEKPNYDILFRSRFIAEGGVDEEGWIALFTSDEVGLAQREEIDGFGEPRLGVDVAHGGLCWNVWALRYQNAAYILRKDRDKNLMGIVGKTLHFMEEYEIKAPNVSIDGTGVGAGVVDRMWEQKINVSSFIAGEKALDEGRFVNRRAEAAWRMRKWIKEGGILRSDSDWDELADIFYKVHSDRRIQLMPKEKMAKRGISSPDCADALALTFGSIDINRPTTKMSMETLELREELKKKRKVQSRGFLSKI